ncbi:hypothetical protein HRbin21_00353 [bacterium HR21]|nr:hypothetical protein HRbin21_00353 [bacterium HR21]
MSLFRIWAGTLFLGMPAVLLAQSCHPGDFAAFGKDPAFQAAHPVPQPIDTAGLSGVWLTVPTAGGVPARLYSSRADLRSASAVLLIFHEWWGLTAAVQQEVLQWAAELPGAVVVAVDLYDGKKTDSPQEAARLMQAVSEQRIWAILQGVLAALPRTARIATLGWCFGGGWALQMALLAGDQAAGCVMYYGMPELELERLRKLHCPVLGIFARRDRWITPQLVQRFQQAMRRAGKQLTVVSYDADHAFANPSNPQFDSRAAEDARRRAREFIRKHLLR